MAAREGGTAQRPALFFDTAEDFRRWLERHHATEAELWMGLWKKHVSPRGLEWADAVVEALRYGWIDSQVQRVDEDAVRQRWTPRRPGSTWSTVNVATVRRLVDEGRMTPAGLAAFERRRPDRQGIYSYEQDGQAALPPHYEASLLGDPAARAFWQVAPPGYRRICLTWVLGAKREATRDRRLSALVADCAAGRLIPSQRYGATPSWVSRAAEAARTARG